MSWNFDARQFEPSAGIEVWPAGKHPVIITASEEKPIKGDKPGFFWQFTLKCIDGPMRDKVQILRINHKNANQQAMDIAHRTMSAICYVTGVLQFNHPNMLHNIPFVVEAIVQKSDKIDGDGNPVRGADGKIEQREQNEFRSFFNMQGVSAIDLAKGAQQGGGAPANAGQWQGQPQQGQQPPQQPPANTGGQWQQPGQPQQPPQGQQPQGGGQWQQPPQGQPQQPQPPQGGQWQQPPQQPPQGGQAWQGGQPTQQAQQPQQAPQQTWQQQPPQGGGNAGGPAPWGPQGGQG